MLSDEDLWRCSREELIRHVQKTQHDKLSLLHEHSNKMKDVNQRLQTHLLEIRNLKDINKNLSEINEKLQFENEELRNLCCYLDDDRQKYRKLSKEWQRFGRHTSSVIRSEVASQQTKLESLSDELDVQLKDNEDLKELVLYLDSERSSAARDQGDGSSGNSDDQLAAASPHKSSDAPPPVSEETMKYIQHLEERIDLLESQLRKEMSGPAENAWMATNNISQAMKVLEVHKRVESAPTAVRPRTHSSQRSSQPPDSFDRNEKALLRELCNVALKSLEEEATPRPHRPIIPQNSRV